MRAILVSTNLWGGGEHGERVGGKDVTNRLTIAFLLAYKCGGGGELECGLLPQVQH